MLARRAVSLSPHSVRAQEVLSRKMASHRARKDRQLYHCFQSQPAQEPSTPRCFSTPISHDVRGRVFVVVDFSDARRLSTDISAWRRGHDGQRVPKARSRHASFVAMPACEMSPHRSLLPVEQCRLAMPKSPSPQYPPLIFTAYQV